MSNHYSKYAHQRVLITGAAGTVGSELVATLMMHTSSEVYALDNNETALFFLNKSWEHTGRFHAILGDIRDVNLLNKAMRNIDFVLHLAALKHVGLCEVCPNEAVLTNVNSAQSIIDAAISNNVERLLFTSSDKAVNPTNVMGTTKLLGEKLFTAAAKIYSDQITIGSIRFGNVLGSRGSVLPIFLDQIGRQKNLTLTDPEMTRFIMTLQQAAKLVLNALWEIGPGDTLISKMHAIKIIDLAELLVDRFKTKEYRPNIEIIGMRAGEKLYEELLYEQELDRSTDGGEYLRVCAPFIGTSKVTQPLGEVYNSHNVDKLTRTDLVEFLDSNGLLKPENKDCRE